MRKIKKLQLVFLLLFSIINHIQAQVNGDDTYILAVQPVISIVGEGDIYTSSVEGLLSSTFQGKKRFIVVDRTKFTEVKKEKELQKSADFIDGSTVQQSKNLGAQYLISTKITQVGTSKYSKQKTKGLLAIASSQAIIETGTRANISILCTIIDVATGSVKGTKIFNFNQDFDGESDNVKAVQNLINSGSGNFNAWANEVFPVYMKVIKIESLDKKGLPEKILIKGGKEMNLQKSKTLLILNNSSKVDVFYIEKLSVEGKEYTRNIVVGNATIDEEQGDFSICKVRSGAKAIQDCLTQGKILLIKINHY